MRVYACTATCEHACAHVDVLKGLLYTLAFTNRATGGHGGCGGPGCVPFLWPYPSYLPLAKTGGCGGCGEEEAVVRQLRGEGEGV